MKKKDVLLRVVKGYLNVGKDIDFENDRDIISRLIQFTINLPEWKDGSFQQNPQSFIDKAILEFCE